MNLEPYKELESSPSSLKVLCLYAYSLNECSPQIIEKFAKKEHIGKAKLYRDIDALVNKQMLIRFRYDWKTHEMVYIIHPIHCIPVYVYLLTYHRNWLQEIALFFSGSKKNNQFLQMTKAALKGETAVFKMPSISELDLTYLHPTMDDPRFYPIIIQLPSIFLNEILKSEIALASENDNPSMLNQLQELLKMKHSLTSSDYTEIKEVMALYRFYAFGEYQAGMKPQTMYGLFLEAIHSLYAQNYSHALECFTAGLKIKNKVSDEKNVLSAMANSFYLVMTYVKEGSADSMKKLGQLLKKKGMQVRSTLPASCIGKYFTHPKREMEREYIISMSLASSPSIQAFAYLFAHYSAQHTDLNILPKEIAPKQAFLRHELAPFLHLTDEEQQTLEQQFGGKPVLASIYVKQPWEMLLESLLPKNESESQSKETRLMYLISGSSLIDVREQTRLKSGEWGAGKNISLKRYHSGEIDCMDETDQTIWREWRRSGRIQLTTDIALPELVGSDRVYTGRYAPFTQVTVTQENPYLVIEKKGNQLKVSSNYQDKKESNTLAGPTHMILRKTDSQYVVFPLQGEKRRVYQQLLNQQSFPMNAEDKLNDFFAQMGGEIEVHSSILETSDSLDTLEGQAAICLQVHPQGNTFSLFAFAKPLPEGNCLFLPGQGIGIIIDKKDGIRYQVKRKLKEETKNFEALAYFIEENCEETFRQNEVVLKIDQMLNVMEYIQPQGDTYFMEWPEGEKLRIKNALQSEKWDIRLKSNHNWFDIEGEINLDDNTLMSIGQLLELVGNSHNKYIRLNEQEFLHLSDSLQKQLARLEAIAVKQQGKMKLTSFQAGLLGNDILNGEMTIQCDEQLENLRAKVAESKNLQAKVPTQLKATLREYQVEGFQWIARLNNWGAGACLADDMGLGKTLQSIAYLLYKGKEGPSLVVAPASVVPNWKKELQRFAPSLHVHTLNESEDRESCLTKAKKMDIILSSYGLLISESKQFVSKHWNVVCLDEAHTIKNRSTKTSGCVMQLQAEHRLILTGTPIQNHLGELWNLFQFINPGLLGSYEHFQQKFILPIEQDHDKQRQLQLNRIVHPFMLRRTKQEVVEELPDKEEITVPVELSDEEMAVYEVIRQRAKELIEEGGEQVNVVTLSEITRLRLAACCASLTEKKWKGKCSKIEKLLELMAELKEGGNRALIFSQFTSFFTLIRKALDKAGENYLYLDGSVPVKQREKLVQEFQEGDCPFFLISLKAGGLGLNLTGANYIIHLDPWWNPAIEQQATDRAYRIGQTQKVTAYHLISSHTIEEKIIRLHENKRNLADALLDGTDMSHKLTAQELMEILEQ
ncbi:SNF2 family helicase [gut metagenome]|uniref:SNF2 family helicase n=1 Tax=gut metagenome TaxID=749906 RepID=J9F5L1_9ZZZZ